MDADQYIESRLQVQYDYYDAASLKAQRAYRRLRRVEIALAALVPFLVGFVTDQTPWLKVLVGAATVGIAISGGLLSMQRYQERWIGYRSTAEALLREKHLFVTGSAPYREGDAFQVFVANVEALLARENSEWAASASSADGFGDQAAD